MVPPYARGVLSHPQVEPLPSGVNELQTVDAGAPGSGPSWTSILVTHQLRDAYNVARTFMMKEGDEYVTSVVDDISTVEGTEFMMLREGTVVFEGSPHELQTAEDPYIREFVS